MIDAVHAAAPTTGIPNSRESIGARVEAGRVSPLRVWAMLFARVALFAVCQSLIALAFTLAGAAKPWASSVAWWPVSATLANLANIVLLLLVTRAEGIRMQTLYNGNHASWKRDSLWFLGALLVLGPIAVLPSSLLALALWGDANAATTTMFQSLPMWAALPTLVLFPLSIAFSELPTYFGYVMPRLQVLTQRRVSSTLLVAAVLAAQHAALPLVFEWRFATWRLLMYAPFALFLGWALDRRPTLMPYFMVVHGLLDLSVPVYVMLASTGRL